MDAFGDDPGRGPSTESARGCAFLLPGPGRLRHSARVSDAPLSLVTSEPFRPVADPRGRTDVELLALAGDARDRIHRAVSTRVVGQDDALDALLVALFARGHALVVGVPGLAKTLLVSTLGAALDLSFGRVQFTPDLLPSDVTGADVLVDEVVPGTHDVRRAIRFLPGPVFHSLVLADEVNRTPPKTQAALLQAMQEREVTVGSTTHKLPDPFSVFATRNPIEQEGTYSLPEAQLDRFLLEVHLGYPSEAHERAIARKAAPGPEDPVPRVLGREDVLAIQSLVPRIPITDEAVRRAVAMVRCTRPEDERATSATKLYVRFGAGPRASQALVRSAKARAALRGEAAADVHDILALAPLVLRHRIVRNFRAESEGIRDVELVRDVVEASARAH